MWVGDHSIIRKIKPELTIQGKYGVQWNAGRCKSACVTDYLTHDGLKACVAGITDKEYVETVHYIALNDKACLQFTGKLVENTIPH